MIWKHLYDKIGVQPLHFTNHNHVKIKYGDYDYGIVTGIEYENGIPIAIKSEPIKCNNCTFDYGNNGKEYEVCNKCKKGFTEWKPKKKG